MKILAHRGGLQALHAGFGIETDLRESNGSIVIAHDLPTPLDPPLAPLLAHKGTFALNIKQDGLAPLLMPLLKQHHVTDYFLFDMSVPEALRYLAAGAAVWTRQSEHELHPAFYEQAAGVWLDEFSRDWVTQDILTQHRARGKALCIVSPELHGRPYLPRWETIRRWKHDALMLCTDHPEEAARFFHG